MWDITTPFGARVERRLSEELMIWLVTQGSDGTPQPTPIWFLHEGHTVLFYSRPDTPKLRAIIRAPQVSLHFDSDGHGGNIIVFSGTAAHDPLAPAADALPAYLRKYHQSIERIRMTPERFAEEYTEAIRVTLTALRGH